MLARRINNRKLKKSIEELRNNSLGLFINGNPNIVRLYLKMKRKLYPYFKREYKLIWDRVEYILYHTGKLKIGISDLLDFIVLNVIALGIEEGGIRLKDSGCQKNFIYDIEQILRTPTKIMINLFIKHYSEVLDELNIEADYKDILGEKDINVKKIRNEIHKLGDKFNKNEYKFIDSIDYSVIESSFTYYIIAENLIKKYKVLIEDFINHKKGIIAFLSDEKVIKNENYRGILDSFIIKQKNELQSPLLEYLTDIPKDDHIEIARVLFEVLELINPNIFLEDLEQAFLFNGFNEQKMAGILYNFLHIFHSENEYELMAECEWISFQDETYHIGSSKKTWNTNMVRQTKAIIPNFDTWKNKYK